MAVENLTGATYIHTTWADVSAQATARNLPIQYYDDGGVQYWIWVADDKLIYSTVIFQGTIPAVSDYVDQAANDAAKTDFETNFQPTANQRMDPQVFDLDTGAGVQRVLGVSLRKSASGGSVELGTATDPVRVDPTGTTTQPVTGTGIAGTPAAGVVTVQGITGGEPIEVTGAISATNPSVGTNNAAAPASSTQVGGSDGTNLQATRIHDLDTGGGTEYNLGISLRLPGGGGSVAGGTATDPIRVDPTGTTAQPVTDNGTSLTVDTPQLPAALVGGRLDSNIGAWLGSTAPTVGQKTMANSVPVVLASDQSAVPVSFSVAERATFSVVAPAVVLGNNKSMISIVNVGTTVVTRVIAVYVVNVQTTAVTGVVGTFELRRITGHSAGTLLTPGTMDTSDTLDADVTIRTGSTVAGEGSLLHRALFSTDDWGPGTADVESADHVIQTMFPVFRRLDSTAKVPTLRQNEGITIKFATNSTAGVFDLVAVITQE